MANIKSAKKRILVNRTKAARNKSIRSAVKTSIKKVEAAVQNNDKAAAQVALNEAIATIIKAMRRERRGAAAFPWKPHDAACALSSGATFAEAPSDIGRPFAHKPLGSRCRLQCLRGFRREKVRLCPIA